MLGRCELEGNRDCYRTDAGQTVLTCIQLGPNPPKICAFQCAGQDLSDICVNVFGGVCDSAGVCVPK